MNFATLHFDTYKVVNLLVSKGYTKDEAEGFIEAIQEVTLSGVATKQDVDDVKDSMNNLKQDIHDFKVSTKQDVDDVKDSMNDLKQDIHDFKVGTKQDIHDLKQEIHDVRNDMLKFQLIQTTTLIGVMVALFAFF